MKKFFALTALLLALGALCFVYFKKEEVEAQNIALYTTIPNKFPLAIESANWEQLVNKLDTFSYGDALNDQDWYVGIKTYFSFIQTLQENLDENYANSLSNDALFSFGNAGNGNLGILLALRTNGLTENGLKEALESAKFTFTNYSFEGRQMFELKNYPGADGASCSYLNGVLLFSFQSTFVEEAILAMDNEETLTWESLPGAVGESQDAKLYLKPAELDFLSSYLFNTSGDQILGSVEKHIGISVLELNFFRDEWVFNGFSKAGNTTILDTLKFSYPGENSLVDYLPSNTAFYKTVSSGNSKLFESDNFEFKNLYSPVKESFTLFTLESFNDQIENRKGMLIALNEEDWLERFYSLDVNLTKSASLDGQEIYKSQMGTFLNAAFLSDSYFTDTIYFTSFNGVAIISSYLNVIEQCILSRKENNILRTNTNYMDFKSSLASKSNLDVYLNVEYLSAYFESVSTENSWQDELAKVNLQFTNSGDRIYSFGKLNFRKPSIQESKVLWKTKLSATSSFKPQIVKNHNTGEKELMVQDASNILYLISSSGEKLWEKSFPNRILGDIYQIDYYKNDKLQYVFNTSDKIYVLDRNGNMVDDFPIDLPAKATNGMLVINYDNAGIYRFMVACDNGNIYGYEQNGSPLAGWSPKEGVGEIIHSLHHVLNNGKDYIYFNNTQGDFYALNRKGELRFSVVKTGNESNIFRFNENKFVGGDKGAIYEIDLSGDLNTKEILDSSYQHFTNCYSIMQSSNAYAFASDSNFKFQQSQWKNFASFTSEQEIRKITHFVNNNHLWFLVYTKDQVYMIDELGTLHPDFPITTKSTIRVIPLLPGKGRLVLYNDLENNLCLLEVRWPS